MKYMGSKRRIAKYILPIILKDRKPGQWYIEPFVGGANMIDKVDGKRAGCDVNKYLIEALKLIRDNPETIPDIITEEDYKKAQKEKALTGLTGFIGFAMSFGGKWFGGYGRDVAGTEGCIENMRTQTRRRKQSALKQSKDLQGVIFKCCSYLDIKLKEPCIIYCDPPYQGTTKYKDDINHDKFWQWCRDMKTDGHTIFISEYNAPDDFKCIWQKEITSSLTQDTGSKKGVEKLFTI